MFNLKDWRIEDSYPGTPLDEIDPISSRAWAALIRSKDNDVVQQGFLNLVGAIDMMRGLEYHHTNFCNIVGEIALLPLLDSRSSEKKLLLVHEAVAYLNRLGQFYHFASSQFVATKITSWENMIPTIIKFKRFRDKHGAHRSIDKPRREDNPHVQKVHAWSFSSLGGHLFSPKPGKAINLSKSDIMNPYRMWTEFYLCFQMIGDGENDTLNLSIEREHPIFIIEAYDLISSLLSLE